jgi:hypothetical protein
MVLSSGCAGCSGPLQLTYLRDVCAAAGVIKGPAMVGALQLAGLVYTALTERSQPACIQTRGRGGRRGTGGGGGGWMFAKGRTDSEAVQAAGQTPDYGRHLGEPAWIDRGGGTRPH